MRIGIIGGSGPQAGIDLWEEILALHSRTSHGKDNFPHVVIHSVPLLGGPHGFHDLKPETPGHKPLLQALENTIRLISKSVDVFCIACNTLHYLDEDIRRIVDKVEQSDGHAAHFLSIVDCAIDAIASSGVKRVSIMGSMLTSDVEGQSPYARVVRDLPHVHCTAASIECRKKQQLVINAAKRDGPHCAEAQDLMAECLDELLEEDVDLVALSCTELPLVMAGSTCSRFFSTRAQFLNPTQELARQLLMFQAPPSCVNAEAA